MGLRIGLAVVISAGTIVLWSSTSIAADQGTSVTQAAQLAQSAKPSGAQSRESLFEDDKPDVEQPKASGWNGYVQGEVARAYQDPVHWSKARLRFEIGRKGVINDKLSWKISGRFDYDAAYDTSSFYPPEVRKDQRSQFTWRENYLDVSAGDLQFRLGRQHVVWGEMVGLFIADVVSARDMREFILPEPELEMLRIPQWAVRAEYFKSDMKAELLWIPYPSFDEIGKPGADFYPPQFPGPGGTAFLGEDIPARKLSNSNFGARLSALKGGWDMSAFFYRSLDASPTFYRDVLPGPAPVFVYQPKHDRISQVGGTVSKDVGSFVIKGEAVYTTGRRFSVARLAQPDGVVQLDTLDYALGVDVNMAGDTRLNIQFFQRVHVDYDEAILQDKYESGASALVETKLGNNVEARALIVHSLNRSDWLFRPKISWMFRKNWRLQTGVDIFSGPQTGLFGRYDNNDRVYAELRHTF